MTFEDCLKKGLIRRDIRAGDRVSRSLEVSTRFLSSARNNYNIHEYEITEMAAYACLFHAARALLFRCGYLEHNHSCLIQAVRHLYKDALLAEALDSFDKIRLSRHNVQYGGDLVDPEEAEYVVRFADDFLELAHKILDV